jgi:MYXO-CTERM domain-containing protein
VPSVRLRSCLSVQRRRRLTAAVLALGLLAASPSFGVTVTVHNDVPRRDQNGDIVDAHDGSLMRVDGTYYLYGTAYNNQNGFSFSNRFVVYSSPDLVSWTFHGDIMNAMDSEWGMYFRPHVVFNPNTGKYVLWYNWYPRGANWTGRFGVATADQPWGPFTVQNANVHFPQGNSVGDFAIAADDDGTGWCVYGWHNGGVAKLSSDYLSIGSGYSPIGSGEGFAVFKRSGIYYYLWGNLCCFCAQGSSAQVARAGVATGPFMTGANIAGASVHAQPLGVLQMQTTAGPQYAYLGDRWQSTPDGVKGHDFIYISEPMQFSADGSILPLAPFTNSFTVDLAPGAASAGPAVTRNLAKGKTVTASSSYENGGWGRIQVTDGGNFSQTGVSMGWSSNETIGANHTEWLAIDLGASYEIDRIVLYPRVTTGGTGTCPSTIPDDSQAGAGFPSDFSIDLSTDNSAWTTVISQTGYPAPYIAPQRFAITPSMARYVRITGTQLRLVSGEYRLQLAEVGVYEAAASAGGAAGASAAGAAGAAGATGEGRAGASGGGSADSQGGADGGGSGGGASGGAGNSQGIASGVGNGGAGGQIATAGGQSGGSESAHSGGEAPGAASAEKTGGASCACSVAGHGSVEDGFGAALVGIALTAARLRRRRKIGSRVDAH